MAWCFESAESKSNRDTVSKKIRKLTNLKVRTHVLETQILPYGYFYDGAISFSNKIMYCATPQKLRKAKRQNLFGV